jgi:NAD+ kinase
MQIAVYSRFYKEKEHEFVQDLFDVLSEIGATTYVYKPYYEQLKDTVTFKKEVGCFDSALDFRIRTMDFVVTLGGDGTILQVAALVRDSNVPILGINLGRLGFLATVSKEEIKENIMLLFKGKYSVEKRVLLQMDSSPHLFGDENFALNDCTLLKRDTSSMIIIHTYINGELLNSYWADGIIVATPTGSTGYSLSCGGPIVFPNSGNFVITPVAPHNLSVRPIVIPDRAVISFEVEGRAENFLCTLDSRHEVITSEYQIAVRRANFTISLVRLDNKNFLSTIREKLAWGSDLRN